jgi:hypothetical protein
MCDKVDSFHYSGKGNRANIVSNFRKPRVNEQDSVDTTLPAERFLK